MLKTPEKIAELFLGMFKNMDEIEEGYYDVVLEYAGNSLNMQEWAALYKTAEVRLAMINENMKKVKELVENSRLLSNTEMRERGMIE